MADRLAIARIAKILASATSPEPHEASLALEHAYKRMRRDGVTLSDLLTLPESELFQDTLVRLVDVILSDQKTLSPSEKRTAYAEYMRRIVAKFNEPQTSHEQPTDEPSDREDAARAYRERHGYREKSSADTNQENDKSFKQKNDKTNKPNNDSSFDRSISLFGFLRPLFQSGGVAWLLFHHPLAMLRLFAASVLWGMGFAIGLMTVAAVAHALTDTKPWLDVGMKALFSFLTAVGTLWRLTLFLRCG